MPPPLSPVLPERLRQSGAFDLPSILIGVAVVAILAIGVMAAIFGVIPWAQDRAAQQDLAAVSTAQGTTYAHAGSFTGKTALVGAAWLGEGTPATLETKAGADGECYVAVTTSKTGNRFMVSDDNQTPRPVTGTDTWCSGVLITPDPAPVMISTWDTGLAASCREITLPVTGFKGTVNWGDGTTDAKTTHTYASAREVSIRIEGTFTDWGSNAWPDANCLVSVDRWGSTGTTDLTSAFWNADNLRHVESIPASTTSLNYAFSGIDSNFTLGKLDTSNVTSMQGTFMEATKFNRPLPFDTSKVANMLGMFKLAEAFNQPLDLDTSKATNMAGMFEGARDFNQPLELDTSQATTLAGMFAYAQSFNQPLRLATSNVNTMSFMFMGATAFNQALNFDTSKVTTMYGMFNEATAFNQPLSFNTARLTTMQDMFWGAASFNQPLTFDTSRVTNMNLTFHGAVSFNQNLSAWNVAKVASTNHAEFDTGATAWKLPRPAWAS